MPSTGIGVGIFASLLLALLTTSVFYVLRDYGPESAIRKYNEAILDDDRASLDQISAQPSSTPDGSRVAIHVGQLLARGARLRLDDMVRDPTHGVAVATVDYVMPDQQLSTFWFVVLKENHVWKVSPTDTARAFAYKTNNLPL